ncbi:iron ABC transporter permease [Sphaerisporangium sp. NPDC051017]|uniref:FecCD family ABC transporter permease n=1 Tax=Sphaerisporangium sp. NPDC051017 TaxID=3154636 RepID=UPI0034267336
MTTEAAVMTAEAAAPTRSRRSRRRYLRIRAASLIGVTAATAVLLVAYVAVGSGGIAITDVARTIWIGGTGRIIPADFQRTYDIVAGLRLPRVLVAAAAGAALSLAGVVMQAILRNPLVSPFTLGVSPAAAFGAALVIVLSGGAGNGFLATVAAFVTAAAAALVVLGLAHTKSSGQITATVLLLGIALTQLFEAATSAMQFVADQNTLAAIVRWTFGSVNEATWGDFQAIGIVTVLSAVIIMINAKHLNAIAFAGEDAARSLGANVTLIRFGLIALSVLLAAVVVSLCGVIGFVGLVGPHIARLIIGPDHRHLVPFSIVTGALLLATADTVGRIVLAPIVVPVGIVIAVVGAPLFIYLILSRRTTR